MNTITGGLRARLERFEIDEPGATLPFTARLARENGWTLAFAGRVIREYKRFLFLTAAAGHPVTPSEEVDQAWHLHMVYTRSYWDRLCGEVLGRPLHHDPTQGGAAEGVKFHDWYSRTLESYRTHFGAEPPADIWPPALKRFAHAGRARWVDCSRALVIPLPFTLPRMRFSLPLVLMAAVGIGALFLPSCSRRDHDFLPRDWFERPLLALFAVLYAAAITWSGRIKARKLAELDPGGEPTLLTDPYETAFLAGGGKRVMQSAITRLAAAGALEIINTRWANRQRVRATGAEPKPIFPVERGILDTARCVDGVPMPMLLTCAAHSLAGIEARLAVLGIKPTASERGSVGLSAMLPFVLLLGCLLITLFTGIAGNRPVGFLLIFIGITFVTGIILATRTSFLTPAGQQVLSLLRTLWISKGTPRDNPDTLCTSVALFGLPMLAGVEGLHLFHHALQKAHPAVAGGGGGGCGGNSGGHSYSGGGTAGCSSSGCGSSGCGSSGCGSSGCGGGGGGGGGGSGCGGGS